jgi:hypothetical protein
MPNSGDGPGACKDHIRRLVDAVKYAADAFARAADEHACDYCRADAAAMQRAVDALTSTGRDLS